MDVVKVFKKEDFRNFKTEDVNLKTLGIELNINYTVLLVVSNKLFKGFYIVGDNVPQEVLSKYIEKSEKLGFNRYINWV